VGRGDLVVATLSLYGRESEVRALDLIEAVDERGGALVVRGEAGIGAIM
jgi:hypothetical protein